MGCWIQCGTGVVDSLDCQCIGNASGGGDEVCV